MEAVDRFEKQLIASEQSERPIAPGKKRSPLPPWDPSISGSFFFAVK